MTRKRAYLVRSAAGLAVVALVAAVLVGCDRGGGDSKGEASESETSREKATKKSAGSEDDRSDTRSEEGKDESERADARASGDAESGGSAAENKGGGESTDKSALPKGTEKQQKLLAEAKGAFMRGRLQQAKPKFEKVIATGELTGTQASAYIALGQIYIESGEPQKAVDLIESVPEKGKKIVEIRLIGARAHAEQKQWKEAAETYETIIELQPNYLFVYTALGEIYTQMGEKKKAAKTYKKYENKLTTLARTIEHPDETEPIDRINALDLFSAVSDERAYSAVRAALEDPEPRVRAKAAVTAGQLGLEKAEVDLRAMAKTEKSKRVKRAARRALQKLEQKAGNRE